MIFDVQRPEAKCKVLQSVWWQRGAAYSLCVLSKMLQTHLPMFSGTKTLGWSTTTLPGASISTPTRSTGKSCWCSCVGWVRRNWGLTKDKHTRQTKKTKKKKNKRKSQKQCSASWNWNKREYEQSRETANLGRVLHAQCRLPSDTYLSFTCVTMPILHMLWRFPKRCTHFPKTTKRKQDLVQLLTLVHKLVAMTACNTVFLFGWTMAISVRKNFYF